MVRTRIQSKSLKYKLDALFICFDDAKNMFLLKLYAFLHALLISSININAVRD